MADRQNRVESRSRFDEATRISLVEGDLDTFDDRLGETNQKLDKILWALVGLLISVTTACILLVIQVAGR